MMDIPPVSVHQRVPIILGSKEDVEEKTMWTCDEFGPTTCLACLSSCCVLSDLDFFWGPTT